MMTRCHPQNRILAIFLMLSMLSGCGIASSYRPADKLTIRDYGTGGAYRKTVGVLTLTNSTVFTSDQIATPFMEAFLEGLKSATPGTQVLLPEDAPDAPFLSWPPRVANGDIDAFGISAQARQVGMNAVVSPIIMDIRTSKKDTGFWFFRDVAYILQIQTAATAYDTITGARLSLGILTEKIDISEQDDQTIKAGQEIAMEDLVDVAREMGERLGEQMGGAIEKSIWTTTVVSVEDGRCRLPVGSAVGIQPGDRFSVLGTNGMLSGLNGQRFIVPGTKIGDITIERVEAHIAYGTPDSGSLTPPGSIVVPSHN